MSGLGLLVPPSGGEGSALAGLSCVVLVVPVVVVVVVLVVSMVTALGGASGLARPFSDIIMGGLGTPSGMVAARDTRGIF